MNYEVHLPYLTAPDEFLVRLGALAREQGWGRFFAQDTRLIRLETPSMSPLLVERFTGQEAVNGLFRFEVDCLSPSAHLELEALSGAPVALGLAAENGWRWWHGYVMAAEERGADGGLARYRLTIEPWTAFLALRRNSRIFQDQTVLEAVERLCAGYSMARLRIDARPALPRRAILTQYRETDLAFLRRLLASEGLSCYFEHDPQPLNTAGLDDGLLPPAQHTLVICDSQSDWPACPQPVIRFAGRNAPGQADALQVFAERRAVTVNAVTLAAWDARQVAGVTGADDAPPVNDAVPVLEHYDGRAAQAHDTQAQAERQARLRLHAFALDGHTWHGEGAVRALGAGQGIAVSGHPNILLSRADDNRFTVLSVEHHATNNLPAAGNSPPTHSRYDNRFTAVPADAPIVPHPLPKPGAGGPHNAFVVGVENETLTTGRDHHVKLQFPWQRGVAPHPGGLSDTGTPGDEDGHAPGNERSGTWVRVAEWLAGPDWGASFLPRMGAEVLVEFIDDDLDQPLVTGQLHNGQDTPPWPAGEGSPANHPGVLSGLHLPTLDGQDWNQWQIDDAPGQLRQRLASGYAATQLNLGHLIHQPPTGSTRGAYRGEGFELRTDAWGMLRAHEGLLVSTTARPQGQSTQMDAREATAQLKAAHSLSDTLSQAATRHHALPLTTQPQQHHLDSLTGAHDAPVNGQEAKKAAPGSRTLTDPVERFAQPIIHLDTPSHAVFTTPASTVFFAGEDLSLTSQADTHLAAQHTVSAVSGEATSLFTHDGGIQAIAAHGPLSVQAHSGELEILADDSVTITCVNGEIDVKANKKIVLHCDGAAITLEGPDITLACSEFTVKGVVHGFEGPGKTYTRFPDLPGDKTTGIFKERFRLLNQKTGLPLAQIVYFIELNDGGFLYGKTDEEGFTEHASSITPQIAQIFWGKAARKRIASIG